MEKMGRVKGGKRGRVIGRKIGGGLWVGKGLWLRVGKSGRVMSGKNGDGYWWEKG